MQRRSSSVTSLADQVGARFQRRSDPPPSEAIESAGVISTGSTLLDLAISGQRFDFGGIPGGLLVEIFGPSGCGKTVLLCELAGNVQRLGGDVKFCDPEGRINAQFAKLFNFRVEDADYSMPDTIPQLFDPIKKWKPKSSDGVISGAFADSLAALSTKMEMEGEDRYGLRRAKEFSEACRTTCRVITQRNVLLVCSNQVRQNIDAGPYGEKFKSPGGEAIGFYSSLRIRCHSPKRIKRERRVGGKDLTRIVGVETAVDIYKNSIDAPYRTASLIIDFTYGIDDIQANATYLKTNTGATIYTIGERKLGASLERAVRTVEEEGLQDELKRKVVEVWHDVETQFKVERRPKVR